MYARRYGGTIASRFGSPYAAQVVGVSSCRREEIVKTAGAHLLFEDGMGGVLEGLHACGESGGDVFGFVVEEEDVFRWGLKAISCVLIDLRFGLGAIDGVRPGVMVEGLDPCVARAESGFHGIGHVGEDAGADAGALEFVDPGEHGRVESGPEIGVCGDELAELIGSDDDAGA